MHAVNSQRKSSKKQKALTTGRLQWHTLMYDTSSEETKLSRWEEKEGFINKQPDTVGQWNLGTHITISAFCIRKVYTNFIMKWQKTNLIFSSFFLSPYYMLSWWPLIMPQSGKCTKDLLIVLSCCFLSWSSRLCSKSVEADRGSPSLTRTKKANRIRDMIFWLHWEQTACKEKKKWGITNKPTLIQSQSIQAISTRRL